METEQFLLNYKQISAMSPPAERNHKDLFKHILNYSVLKEGYRDVIYEKEDYICFVDTHANYVETQLHNLYRMVPYHWLKVSKIKVCANLSIHPIREISQRRNSQTTN